MLSGRGAVVVRKGLIEYSVVDYSRSSLSTRDFVMTKSKTSQFVKLSVENNIR